MFNCYGKKGKHFDCVRVVNIYEARNNYKIGFKYYCLGGCNIHINSFIPVVTVGQQQGVQTYEFFLYAFL